MINIEESKEKKKKIDKNLLKDIITNLVYGLIIAIYIICFNWQHEAIGANWLGKYINISSMAFLAISIVMLELAYRKDKAKMFVYGIEFIVLATFTILIQHMPKIIKCSIKQYTQIGLAVFVAYYIIKIGILYTKRKHDELKSLSDIKEIVKEEPRKKEAKRKNKKEEGK